LRQITTNNAATGRLLAVPHDAYVDTNAMVHQPRKNAKRGASVSSHYGVRRYASRPERNIAAQKQKAKPPRWPGKVWSGGHHATGGLTVST